MEPTGRDYLNDVIEELNRDLKATEQELEACCSRMDRVTESIRMRLANDEHMNDLGEIQGLGPQIDRLVAKRAWLISQLKLNNRLLARI